MSTYVSTTIVLVAMVAAFVISSLLLKSPDISLAIAATGCGLLRLWIRMDGFTAARIGGRPFRQPGYCVTFYRRVNLREYLFKDGRD